MCLKKGEIKLKVRSKKEIGILLIGSVFNIKYNKEIITSNVIFLNRAYGSGNLVYLQ